MIINTERKTANRKSRSEDGVWTDNNSGMKQEDNHFADADPRGRFPANLMHDGSDVITKEFPQTGKSKWLNIDNKTMMFLVSIMEVTRVQHMR